MNWPKKDDGNAAWIAAYERWFRTYDDKRLRRARTLLESHPPDAGDVTFRRITRLQLAAIDRIEQERP